MRNTNKKGFTIVELVIVVAVIAILAAVLIPTFSNIIKKANLSADQQAVRNMNLALAAETEKPANIIEAAAILAKAGFNTEKGLTPLYTGHAFYWFKPTNQVVYVNEAEGKFELIFPESVEGFPAAKNDNCQSLEIAIEGTINAPVVESTDVVVDSSVCDVTLPETVTDFESLMAWISNDTDKGLTCTVNGSPNKTGIVFPSGNIKLSADIVLDTTNMISGVGNTLMLNIVEDTTIDLNGHKIIQHGSGLSLSLFVVRDGATLNIIDSSAEQTGAICASYTAFQIDTGATVNLYSGTIDVTDDDYRGGNADSGDLAYGCQLVFIYGGTFNMYGGKLDADVEQYWNTAIGTSYYKESSACYLYAGEIIGDVAVSNVPSYTNYGATITGDIVSE